MRFDLLPLILAFAACKADTLPGGATSTASQAAHVGDACTVTADCAGTNGDCIGGVCRGGDSDPCEQVAQPYDPGPCLPGFACAPCDVAIFGGYECACTAPDDVPPSGCAPSVCLPMADACSVSPGCAWDPVAQSCGCP